MNSLFINKGPFDINFIIKKTLFSKKEKFQKKKIKNVSNLIDSQKVTLLFLKILNILII